MLARNSTPRPVNFVALSAFARVDDGWLIGFNHGEFGAALYWFSLDGNRNYKISDHQVVDFISTPDGFLAVEGLAHLGNLAGLPDPRHPREGRETVEGEITCNAPVRPLRCFTSAQRSPADYAF